MDDTNQVTEHLFDDKEAGERDEEGEESKKRASKANKLLNWWRKMWTAPRDTHSRSQHEKEDDPRTGPKKDPDEAGKKSVTTCVGELDMGAKTMKQLGGGRMCFTQQNMGQRICWE